MNFLLDNNHRRKKDRGNKRKAEALAKKALLEVDKELEDLDEQIEKHLKWVSKILYRSEG
ncbi:hypothetical protein [Wolbachia endosymbiont of Cantharis cryptica]|uniref:hypothetical protein n=1 Tax=Wolbachia endosymbiont of Cantharis cryptica TaxID=3066132 RepID=UPI00376EE53E